MADKTMLNFKYGIFSRLPETQVPGTVYVTADEKAMYVDLPAVTAADGSTIAADRIRVSQIIVKNSSRDAQPPFSEDAFYYFVEENALLKWIPATGEVAAHWKQINSVSDVEANLNTLVARVTTNEASITALQGEDTRIEGLITAEANRAKAEEERLAGLIGDKDSGLTKAIADEAARADAEEKRLAGLISTNESAITTLQGRATTLEGKVSTLEGTVGNSASGLVKDLADAVARIEAAEEAIESNDGDISTINGQISTINGTLGTQGSAITALQEKDTELGNSINTLSSNKVDKSVYEGKVSELEGEISDNATAASNAQKAAEAAQSTANANGSAITTLQGTVGDASSGLVKGLADANAAIQDLDDTKVEVSTYNAKVGELNEAIAAAKKAGDDAQADADANASAITTLQTAIGESGLAGDLTALAGRVTDTENLITGHGTRLTAVEEKASANENAISGHGTRLTAVEEKASANESAITALQGRMSTAEGAIEDLDEKIGTIPTDSGATNVIDYINGQFEAADAMHYMGGIDDPTDLPTTGVQAGDTYVVTVDNITLAGESYYAGDLIIANADQGTDATYNGGWTHVVTGYQANHNAQLAGANNKISLTTLAGGVSLGEIEVETDGSMLTATVANNTLSLGLEWGSF